MTDHVLTRQYVCTRCNGIWEVMELPAPFIDPGLYVCPDCLVEVPDEEPVQLRMPEGGSETRRYDPSIAEVPY